MPSRAGSRNGFPGLTFWAGHWAFFARFVAMLYLVELYDIVFFAHFYPGSKGIGGPHQFGCNKKVHALHFVFYLPVSPLLAWVCTLL